MFDIGMYQIVKQIVKIVKNCKADAEMNVVFINHILLLYQKNNLNVSLLKH